MYPTILLHNTATGRYHPMPFRLSPRPSDTVCPGEACRHRSIGHHTLGFDTKEGAEAHIKERGDRFTGAIAEWDGEVSPHCHMYFELLDQSGAEVANAET